MASLADVLRHLVKYAPDLYEEGRKEFLAAIDAAPELAADRSAPPEQAPPEQAPAPAQDGPGPQPWPQGPVAAAQPPQA